jgi:hypothetical protein
MIRQPLADGNQRAGNLQFLLARLLAAVTDTISDSKDLPMRSLVAAVLFLLGTAALAAPYPLGTMTCEDIAQFASESMGWRKADVPKEEALARLEEREYGDPVEKRNLTVIVDLVYGRYGNNWSIEGAGRALRGDCLRGREE